MFSRFDTIGYTDFPNSCQKNSVCTVTPALFSRILPVVTPAPPQARILPNAHIIAQQTGRQI